MKNQKRISTGLWVFLAVLLIVTAFVGIAIYNNISAVQRQAESAAIEKTRQEAISKENDSTIRMNNINRSYCINAAQKAYEDGWNADVAYLGRDDGRLPESYSSVHEKRLKDAKDECYRQYGY